MPKSKSKSKGKSPSIDPRLLARPRLDALFDRHGVQTATLPALLTDLHALIAQAGAGAALGALIQRLRTLPEAERHTFLAGAAGLAQPAVVAELWRQARDLKVTPETRAMTLHLLRALGEDADPASAAPVVDFSAPLRAVGPHARRGRRRRALGGLSGAGPGGPGRAVPGRPRGRADRGRRRL